MKHLPTIAATLLGLAFIFFGAAFFLDLMPKGENPPADSPMDHFFAAIGTTGFLAYAKTFEIIGGILVAIPKTRNIGLLILGPIVINIIAINIFIAGGNAVFQAPVIIVSVLSAYLLFDSRKKFANLLN